MQRGKLAGFAKDMRKAPTGAETACDASSATAGFQAFRRQVTLGGYIADFVCFEARLIVEADGSQHAENARDRSRDKWFEANGFRIRRF